MPQPEVQCPVAVPSQESHSHQPTSKDNKIYLHLNSTQVKTFEQLTGNILLDIKTPIDIGCSVVLVIECKERVYSNDIVIYEEVLMCVRSEVYQVKADSQHSMPASVYKIPLNIDISEIFDSSECFKLDKNFTVKVEYDLYCQVVQFLDQQQSSQARMINKINDVAFEKSTNNNNNVNRISDQIDMEGQVLLESTAHPFQIINHVNDKKSHPVTITQRMPNLSTNFFRSLGKILCCKGTRQDDYKEEQSKKKGTKKSDISFFNIDMNAMSLYPGETFSFIINDDSKKPTTDQNEQGQYQTRLISKQVISINRTPYMNESKVLFEKNVHKGQSEKITIPYQSLNSYKSNVFKNSYELQVVPLGHDFSDKSCLKVPIHVNPKKLKLIPLQNESEEQEKQNQSVLRLLEYPCKVIAKIQLKFDEQFDDPKDLAASQGSTKLNTPDITPLRRSFE